MTLYSYLASLPRTPLIIPGNINDPPRDRGAGRDQRSEKAPVMMLRGRLCVGLDGTRTRYVAASAADTCVLYCPQKPEGSRIERGEGDPSDENAYDTRRDFLLEWTAVQLSVILDPRIRGPLQRSYRPCKYLRRLKYSPKHTASKHPVSIYSDSASLSSDSVSECELARTPPRCAWARKRRPFLPLGAAMASR
ncbi:hypothetical protein BV22DRAFT_940276 [Leucogyrophana mollusca]|uniref:Uncharacterized protein n=1 Tax=Leucogyrophana mollusca TaxID=85980 RepID=A0ACB8AUY8_9AGAM|nr:hypothetical protein BV22DRAFT_940276 [Leucogyrophana mollusca]